MAQGRKSRARGGRSTATAEKPAEPAEEATAPFNGVLVRVEHGEAGPVRHLQALGDTKVNELPTLLRLAAKDVERELGID